MSKRAANAFSIEVEKRVTESGETYISTIFALAEEMEIDEDQLPKLISESLRQRLYIEGVNERTIKPENTGDAEDLSEWV